MKINKDFEMKEIHYYTAAWCQPCQILGPIMNELSNTYSMSLGSTYPIQKIDIDTNKELQRTNNIQGIPTVIVFENGTEKKRLVGVKSKTEYINAFEN